MMLGKIRSFLGVLSFIKKIIRIMNLKESLRTILSEFTRNRTKSENSRCTSQQLPRLDNRVKELAKSCAVYWFV